MQTTTQRIIELFQYCGYSQVKLISNLFCKLGEVVRLLVFETSIYELERVCSQIQLRQLRYFNDCTKQLHVTGYIQVVFKRT